MTLSAAERLTSTAARLFQEKGLSRVGINEIIREADVARMSLYNNFQSKEDLALAAYTAMSHARREAIDAATAAAKGPKEAILAIFDLAESLAQAPSFTGCSFINLAAHLGDEDERLTDLVRRHKLGLRLQFEDLVRALGAPDPVILGRQLLALWDGAIADSFIENDTAPIRAARDGAARLIEACPPAPDGTNVAK